PAVRENGPESESPGRLDLGTSVGVHQQTPTELFAAIRPGLFGHRLRTLHRDSRGPCESSVGPLGRQEVGMRHSHIFSRRAMMHYFVGFLIALAVGLTGVGGGSFTVPALVLLVGLPAGEGAGRAFLFS